MEERNSTVITNFLKKGTTFLEQLNDTELLSFYRRLKNAYYNTAHPLLSDDEFDRRYNRYSSQNRRDDYLERRREKQIQKYQNRRRPQTNRKAVVASRAAAKAAPFKTSGIKKYKDYD